MEKRRRWLAVLLAGCMMLTVGCSASEKSDVEALGQTDQAESSGEEAGSETESSTGASASESEENEAAEQKGAPQVHIGSENLDKYTEDGSVWLLHAEYDTLSISGDGYEALSKAAEEWSVQNEAGIQALAEEYAAYADEEGQQTGEYQDYYSNSIYHSLSLTRSDERVVSLLEMDSEYTGGAHGNYAFEGLNFDAQTGELLEIGDLITNGGAFREKTTAYIIQKLKETYEDGLFPDYEDTVEGMWMAGPVWYLDMTGITFIFNPYEVGPYAMGEARVLLPYTEVSEYLKEEYLPTGFEGVYLLPVNTDTPVWLPLSSFSENVLRLNVEWDEEYGDAKISLTLNGQQSEEELFARIDKAYLVCTGGFCYVVLDADYASDDFVTRVYDISTGVVRKTDELGGASMQDYSVINTEKLTLWMHLDVLGTYSGQMDYVIGKDGKLEQQEEFFRLPEDNSPSPLLTTVKELPVVVEGSETTLPAGSRIRIIATDNQGIVHFRDEDTGVEGDIHYTRGDGAEDTWSIYIDGIQDYEYFESLPYAG